jgi:HlyD family secretion protein
MMAASTAPVYSLADEQRSRSESAAWARFVTAGDQHAFCASWLALLAARIERARAALLLVADDDGSGGVAFGVAATWPDARRDLQYLGPVAQRALCERAGVVVAPDGGVPEADGGDLAESGSGRKPVLKLAQIDPLRVDIVLPAALFGQIKPGQKATVTAQVGGGRHEAAVKAVDKVIDAASGTFVARLELPNAKGDVPGGARCSADIDGVSPPAARRSQPG